MAVKKQGWIENFLKYPAKPLRSGPILRKCLGYAHVKTNQANEHITEIRW